MTMSIRRMTPGAGYRYLMSSVARMDQAGPAAGLQAYYAANGTPPGWFLGAGLAGLNNGQGVQAGSVVTEEHLWRMLGMLQDPVTGEQLGQAPPTHRAQDVDDLGRPKKAPQTVAGFDLTFSAPKSVSVAWALADDPTRARIYGAHRRALEAVIGYGESQVFATRMGKGGVIQEDIRGIVATAFDHWDSRAGDPQLHTHVVVLNRVQAVADGAWRTLDSKALYRAAVGMSELYNGVLADELTAELGWGWTPEQRRRSAEPKWEVDGVPQPLREHFSQRSNAIETAKDDLVAAFARSHGRQPTAREVIKLRQQATLATREDKHVRPLRELINKWKDRARPFVGADPDTWVGNLTKLTPPRLVAAVNLDDGMLRDVATVVLTQVANKRATFTRANLLAETFRELHGVRFATPADRVAVAEKTATYAAERAVMLTPPEVGRVPDVLKRADGSSKFRARNSEIYATQELLDAEARLLEAAAALDAPTAPLPAEHNRAETVAAGRKVLSGEQAAAVSAVLTSGRRLDLIVGAAGTGKSTTMVGVRAAWEAAHGPGSVIGLAPSAAAAEVLADAVGVPTENTAKWITEHRRLPERRQEIEAYADRMAGAYPSQATRELQKQAAASSAAYARFCLRPGQLVIVDEASMAATMDLDYITTAAERAGAKVLLVGDWAQLSPVQAGGSFKLLADTRRDAPALHDVRRFRHEWERVASLKLRAGRPSVAAAYMGRGRVESGSREDMIDLIFDGWLTDVRAGRASLMLAADAETVADLNARAHAYRVEVGEVAAEGVRVAEGVVVGVGDVVVTRHNQRSLVTGRGWVKNGDDWIVQCTERDGSMRVQRAGGGAVAQLPATYVQAHVELGYASTAHRAQGRTVDTAHAYVSTATVREPLYVMVTRGRESNRLYVDTTYDPDASTTHEGVTQADPGEVLAHVISASGAELSATATRQAEEAATHAESRVMAESAVVAARHRAVRSVSPSADRPYLANGPMI
ncbi:MobF family relaxase [Humibacillus xanthopallidus]|uniref:Conjugative relaxase-like TrwC/TraI family protein n=1 Tax=Humibacillus xanthopallidus TaxID=412689 RepID=A0A543HTX5_9MICO|nr:MobF family relaxase [Humibacillus xanthopallidus]TQM61740.1 conjugative relaxase-like TrwC/TraI family protein [Humibacillus xanthopallidus]